MNKDDALKLALEAFEANASNENFLVLKHCVREALADSALDRMAENARELGLDYEPPCKTGSQCASKCQQCEQPAQKQEPKRWAVFCSECRKEWSVSYPHPGKSICAECDAKAGAQQQEPVTVLPDGSAFAVMSYPLPKDHWLYADRQYNDGEYEPVELGKPVLTHELRGAVVSAVRYAIRGATNCGKEADFDPDALVQNAVYALCGPFTSPPASKPLTDEQRQYVVEMWRGGNWTAGDIIDAVEAAHGIKGEA